MKHKKLVAFVGAVAFEMYWLFGGKIIIAAHNLRLRAEGSRYRY